MDLIALRLEHDHAESTSALVPSDPSAEVHHTPTLSAALDFIAFVLAASIAMSGLCLAARRAVVQAMEACLRW
jgi:hypothetical protein